MARKTTGSTTTRAKKSTKTTPTADVQIAAQVSHDVLNDTKTNPVFAAPANLEEQIRVRAYELYLQRRATAGNATGNGNGNENQDWLVAEQEILSRYNGSGHHTA